MNKKENKAKNLVNDLKENSQHRAWLFLAIYFIFFAFIIISLRHNNAAINHINNNYMISYFDAEKLNDGNYHFKYSVNIDNNEITYEGDKSNNKELFTKTNNLVTEKYYQENNVFSKFTGISWENVNDPYEIITFRSVDTLKKLIEKSTYMSKTINADRTLIYTYQISTTTLMKELDGAVVDLDDVPNEIKIYTDKYNELIKIEYNFSSYFNYKKISSNSLIMTMEYSDYGKIDKVIKE